MTVEIFGLFVASIYLFLAALGLRVVSGLLPRCCL